MTRAAKALDDLHRRYDATPPHLRQAVLAGGPLYLARNQAKRSIITFRDLARDTIRALRAHPREDLRRDLAFYRREHSAAIGRLRAVGIDIGLAEIEDLAESMVFARNGRCAA